MRVIAHASSAKRAYAEVRRNESVAGGEWREPRACFFAVLPLAPQLLVPLSQRMGQGPSKASAPPLTPLAPTGIVPRYTSQTEEVRLFLAKLSPLDHKYQVREAVGGKPIFVVESELEQDGFGKGTMTWVKDALGGKDDTVLCITPGAAGIRREWLIGSDGDAQDSVGRAPTCKVTQLHSHRKSVLRITFSNVGSDGAGGPVTWVLAGDKVSALAIAQPQPPADPVLSSRPLPRQGEAQ